MAFERRDGTGGAVDTTITADITNVSLSISIASATGWPSGGANGPFFVIIDYDVAGKEKVEVASRTGTTLTVANTSKRGIDDTVAAAHTAGAKIRYCFTEQDRDEANYTMFNTVGRVTTKGDMIVATAAQTFARLAVGANNTVHMADSAQATGTKWAAIDSTNVTVTGTPTTIAPDDAASAGSGAGLAKVDHRHAIAAASAVSIGSANAEGVSSSFARADHTHDLIANSVQSGDLAAGLINDENLFAAALTPMIYQEANPGAVGAGRLWFRPSNECLFMRNAADSGWNLLGTYGAAIAFTPTLFGHVTGTLGTGGNENLARYHVHGRTVIAHGYIEYGTGSSVSSNIAVGLPINAANLAAFAPTSEYMNHGAGRASDVSAGVAYAAVCVVEMGTDNQALDRMGFFATAGVAAWNPTTPFTWAIGDRWSWFVTYERADSSAPAALVA